MMVLTITQVKPCSSPSVKCKFYQDLRNEPGRKRSGFSLWEKRLNLNRLEDVMNPLFQALLAFDGKQVAPLKQGLAVAEAGDFLALVDYFANDNVMFQTGATWLVKCALERSKEVSANVVEATFDAADQYTHWEPKLHALQSVKYLDFEHINREKIAAALPALSDDKKTLVQVWALDADVRLYIENKSQLNRLQQKLNMALETGPASLKARARHLKNEFKALD